MKFNYKELAFFAAEKVGKADKEGILWWKESEGVVKKRDTYTRRWFVLVGNLLFYTKDETKDSIMAGMIVLERCTVESEAFSGNRNAFRLVFQESEMSYWFFADSARDADEWVTCLNISSYEFLRKQLSDLRSQLIHLTGQDPMTKLDTEDWSVSMASSIASQAQPYEGDPAFELSLGCSSLIGGLVDERSPSALVVTHCMTPPQAYWMRYAQTEVIENSCDPQFFTTVVFYEGSVSTATQLKFEVFDAFDRQQNKMRPLGQAQCSVMDLIRDLSSPHRMEVIYDGTTCGYLMVRTRKCGAEGSCKESRGVQMLQENGAERHGSAGLNDLGPSPTSFSFRSPVENIVVRHFQFPIWNSPDRKLKVTEVMGEARFSLSIPMQLLEMFIAEENATISQYGTLSGLSEPWEIIRQEIVLELRRLSDHYRECCEALQELGESGVLFKKSTFKEKPLLEFAPVNLHIQEMKVAEEGMGQKERIMYTAVTVGAPTAYSLKYRQGGLARLQVTVPRLATLGSFSPSTENKAFRVKRLLKQMLQHCHKIREDTQQLQDHASKANHTEMRQTMRSLADSVGKLQSRCQGSLLNDALRDWYCSLDINRIPSSIASLTEVTTASLISTVCEHVVCVEARVDDIVICKHPPANCIAQVKQPLSDLTTALNRAEETFQTALCFVLLKEHYHLSVDKIPVGLKGFTHRRDIVFCHAVTSAVVSFVMKLLRNAGSKHYLTQLQELGFLIHWESLLSTHGDENGMLEDFIVAIYDLNQLKFKLVLAASVNDTPCIKGSRYKVVVEVPVQKALFRVLPAGLREGKEISTTAILFTQGINEQQSLADTFGDNHIQDQINIKSMQPLSQYCDKFRERFGTAGIPLARRAKFAQDLLVQLHSQVHNRKTKNTDILTLSQELCRLLDCGRVTSCKSAKDRTAMAVTLEQAHILLKLDMDTGCFQQALDAMRSQGTRLRNAEKNIQVALYAFNALQVVTLPKNYRPPEGTYKKLQT